MSDLVLRSEIADLASDPNLDPGERIARLREMSGTVKDADLLGQIEGYIGSLELQREAAALEYGMNMVALRENANVREALIQMGQATPEELDKAGFLSHAELDRREEDGTLAEAVESVIEEGRAARKVLRWTKGFEKGGEFRPTRGGDAGRRVAKALDTGREKGDRVADKPRKSSKSEVSAPESPSAKSDMPAAPSSPGVESRLNRDFSADLAEIRAASAAFTDPKLGPVGRRLLAGSKDTQDLYSKPVPSSPGTSAVAPQRMYLPSRAELHSRVAGQSLAGWDHERNEMADGGVASLLGPEHPIVAKLMNQGLSSLTPEDRDVIRNAAREAREAEGQDKPTALFMAGGMAAGKSSALKADPSLQPRHSVMVSADVYKELMPEYQEQKKAGEGAGAGTVHNESNDIAKRTGVEAMDLGLNVVFDGTGKNPDFLDVLKATSDEGYNVDVVGVTIPTDDAVVRAGRRAMESGRGASEATIRDSHRKVTQNFDKVVSSPFVRNVTLWDNGGEIGEPAVLIGRGENGNWSAVDKPLLDAFWAKGDEPDFADVKTEPSDPDAEKLAVKATPKFKEGVAKKAESLGKRAAASPSSPGTKDREKINGSWYKVLPDGSIDVKGDVELAADLLGQGRKVKLNQPDEASTLLKELAKRVEEAKKLGEKAPNYNLCDVAIPGTNLFCVESQGIPRVEMPQLAGFPIPGSKADKLGDEGLIERSGQYIDPETGKGGVDLTPLFVANLRERGVPIERDEVPASHLRATQDELNGANVAKIAGEMADGRAPDGATLVSEDNYIVDGHHRWAAQVGNDAADGKLGDDMMQVDRVKMDIITLLAEAYAYAEEMGLPVVDVAAAGVAEQGGKK